MKRIKILIISFTFCALIQAQIPGAPKNLLSPNAASLGLYGEIPVSLYTGTPNIDIPLYELKYGDVTVPISMSYHASGVRPDQHPGWVGLGWNLNAGGMISREIKDLPDEYDNSLKSLPSTSAGAYIPLKKMGYYYLQPDLNMNVAATDGYIYDSEQDEFSFNFLGYSGKFYYNGTIWKVACDRPIKVTFNNTFLSFPSNLIKYDTNMAHSDAINCGNTKCFSGFTITDEFGTQYIFGGTQSAIEYSINFFDQNQGEWFANSWMLTQIISPNGEIINFNYQRDSFVDQLYLSYNVQIRVGTRNTTKWLTEKCSNTDYSSTGYPVEGMLISPVYLSNISSPNGNISFSHSLSTELRYDDAAYYFNKMTGVGGRPTEDWTINGTSYPFLFPFLQSWDPIKKTLDPETKVDLLQTNCLDNLQWQQLDNITVKNSSNETVKSYNFSYSNSKTTRLTLNSIKEISNSSEQLTGKEYAFDYYDISKLPVYLFNETDHWGYFNNVRPPINPADETKCKNYYGYRNSTSDISIANLGALKKIYYPTGGCTEFIYEQHDYGKQLSINRWDNLIVTNNTKAGGLRIKRIVNYPDGLNISNKIEKEYFYVNNYLNTTNISTAKSSGILGGQIKYFFDDYKIKTRDGGTIYSKESFSSNSVLPVCNNSTGSHIGYSEVIEKLGDGSYTKTFFTNFDASGTEGNTTCLDEAFIETMQDNSLISPYQPYNSREIERGKLLKTEIYDKANAKKYSKNIYYSRTNETGNNINSFHIVTGRTCPSGGEVFDDAVIYKIFTYSYLPVKEIETNYDNTSGTVLTKTVNYEYDANNLVKKQTSNDSKGNSLITQYKYIGNVEPTTKTSNELLDPLIEMNKIHMIAYPIEITNSIKKDNVEYITGAKLLLYKPTDTTPAFYKLWSESSLGITKSLGLSQFKPISILNGSTTLSPDTKYIENMRYNKYDLHGNPLFITRNGVENSIYLWSYNYQYPVAEIKNANWTDIASKISNSQLTTMAEHNEPISTDWTLVKNCCISLNNSLYSLYTFKPLIGLDTKTEPRGTGIIYRYDNFGRLNYILNNKAEILEKYDYYYKVK